ncbi:MAG: hypothetical protein HYY30_07495 [Chloroflexi bacterium]|nr:hypothetical protein [Chloroflexota bacterium]
MTSGSLTVYGTAWCGDCRRARRILDEKGVSYDWIDIDKDLAAQEVVLRLNGGMRSVPTIVFPDRSILVEPSNRELFARLDGPSAPIVEEASLPFNEHASATARWPRFIAAQGKGRGWQGKTVAAGITGSVIASFCCLPTALAIALGLSLSTAATLSQLLAYQRAFQVAGLVFAGLATWWMLRRSRSTCSPSERQLERVPLFVFGAFAVGFLILNVFVIPLLERLPWLLAGP